MKKILTMVAATLMALGTAQAQKVYKMVINKTDGSTQKIVVTDVKDLTFVEEEGGGTTPTVPTTAAEALNTFAGQWSAPQALFQALGWQDLVSDYIHQYLPDGRLSMVLSRAKGASGYNAVLMDGEDAVEPNPSDPTKGTLPLLWGRNEYRNLTSESVEINVVDGFYGKGALGWFTFTKLASPIGDYTVVME